MRQRLSTILLLTGSAVLVWCTTVWTSAALFERFEAWRWNARQQRTAKAFETKVSIAKLFVPKQPAPKLHDVIAWLDIPRLGSSVAVLEGDDSISLRFGAGHIPSTALPGGVGNVGIAAHRDSFFRPLHNIKNGDRLLLRTADATHEYTVEFTRIVPPSAVEVLANDGQSELTLVTCYPFWYVGPAPLRFVVRARQLD
jgi:sortase A